MWLWWVPKRLGFKVPRSVGLWDVPSKVGVCGCRWNRLWDIVGHVMIVLVFGRVVNFYSPTFENWLKLEIYRMIRKTWIDVRRLKFSVDSLCNIMIDDDSTKLWWTFEMLLYVKYVIVSWWSSFSLSKHQSDLKFSWRFLSLYSMF